MRPLEEIAFYEGNLIYMDSKVPYLPNRVLRQFGLIQSIPDTLPILGDHYDQFVDHCLSREMRYPIEDDGPTCVMGYMEWFQRNSHPYVENPEKWAMPRKAHTTSSSNPIDVVSYYNVVVYDACINYLCTH